MSWRLVKEQRVKPRFEIVWDRICKHQGERFRLQLGKEVVYEIKDDILYICGTKSRVRKQQFERAMEMVPVLGPASFGEEGLWGTSYLYAILMDARISASQW